MTKRNLIIIPLMLLWSLATLGSPLSNAPVTSLNTEILFLEDPKGEHTFATIRSDDLPWQTHSSDAFNQGYSDSVWWLKLSISNISNRSYERYLELAYAVLDYVDIQVYSDGELIQAHQLGDQYPYSQRPVDHRFFVLPVEWQPQQTLEFYYRIKTSTAVQAPINLWQKEAFDHRESESLLVHGLYYGALGVIAIYNLLIFIMLRERSYLYYVAFVVSLPLFLASISGHAYRFIWPESVVWNDHSIPIFLGTAFGSSALFARRFLKVRRWSSWIYSSLSAIAALAFGVVAASLILPYNVSIHLLVPLGLFACIFEIVVGVLAWKRHINTARYYVVAWLSFLSGGVLLALNKLNLIPTNFLTEYSIQFGSVAEAVLLSFALAERINEERRLRFAAQAEALNATQHLNEELEQRVKDRTQELELLNAKLEDISNTDSLTKLKNRRYLDSILNTEWSRCRRHNSSISLIMMDLDHFKEINDIYGHLVGDAVLQQVAERIDQAVMRPSDQLTRYGGEEFCAVLPDTGESGAANVAERIRQVIEYTPIITPSGAISITISLGVSVGEENTNASLKDLIKAADTALYCSKTEGRNRVTVLKPENLDNVTYLNRQK